MQKNSNVVIAVVAGVLCLVILGLFISTGNSGGGGGGAANPSIQATEVSVSVSDPDSLVAQYDETLFVYRSEKDNIVTDSTTGDSFVNNELLIKALEGVTTDEVEKIVAGFGGRIVGYNQVLNKYQILFDDIYSHQQLSEMAETLLGEGVFSAAHLNLAFDITFDYEGFVPDDIVWIDDWDDSPEGGNWGIEAIESPKVWEDFRDKMTDVNVGVYDNQFFTDHEDLNFMGTLENDWSRFARFGQGGQDHGTHVSGTIASVFNNSLGITGVMPNHVNLYGASVYGIQDSDTRTIAVEEYGLTYLVVNRQCKVINISYGLSGLPLQATNGDSQAQNRINQINSIIADTLMVFINDGHEFVITKSAGNDNNSSNAPQGVDASWDYFSGISNQEISSRILVVGAAERLDTGEIIIANFSNCGSRVDIIAPGVDIESTTPQLVLRGLKSYDSMSGTSMAAPHVAGVAASVFALNPNFTGEEVKQAVVEGAGVELNYSNRDIFSHESGYRLLNAYNAVTRDMSTSADNATSLVFDVSGSMEEMSGVSGMNKIEAARAQGAAFVNSIKALENVGDYTPDIGIVSFSDDAWEEHSLSSDYASLEQSINMLNTRNMTNIKAGIDVGIRQLENAAGSKMMVLLSDGYDTETSYAAIMQSAQEAKDKGIVIYTIGFGSMGDLDTELLNDIASLTGGSYSYQDASSLIQASVGLFGELMRNQLSVDFEILADATGDIALGETIEVASFEVTENGSLQTFLYWPGSELELELHDPTGTVVTEGYPGYTLDNSTIPILATINNAALGEWSLWVHAKEVSMPREPYYLISAFQASPISAAAGAVGGMGTDNGGIMLVFLLAVVVIAIAGVVYLGRNKGRSPSATEILNKKR